MKAVRDTRSSWKSLKWSETTPGQNFIERPVAKKHAETTVVIVIMIELNNPVQISWEQFLTALKTCFNYRLWIIPKL